MRDVARTPSSSGVATGKVPTTRRVVTGHDPAGKAVVLFDGAAPNVKFRESSGAYSTLLWVTEGSPAENAGVADAAVRDIGTAPPASGSILRIVDFPPASLVPQTDHEAVLAEMGLNPPTSGSDRSPFMHRTKSVDYALILSGEIAMLLDDSEVTLSAGEVLIQRGTNHAWVNRGESWCRIAFVLIDAVPVEHANRKNGPDAQG